MRALRWCGTDTGKANAGPGRSLNTVTTIQDKHMAKTTKKKATAASRKEEAEKKTTVKKKTVTKKTAKKKAAPKTAKKKVSKKASAKGLTNPLQITAEERWRMIATAAYFKAEQRGFSPGNEFQDWLDAEAEINDLISSK